jgi:large subunit ribosomal protein L18
MPSLKEIARQKRHARIRARVSGTAARPRLVVSRSLKHTRAQLVDDEAGKILASASDVVSTKTPKKKAGTKTERATKIGETLAAAAKAAGITAVVFDRSGRKYHGRVRAVAEAARSAGLVF